MPEENKTCNLCDQPLDTTGYPLWCKACRTTKKRALKEAHEQMARSNGFATGAEEMRRAIVEGLAHMNPGGMLRIAETARWIAGVPAPRP